MSRHVWRARRQKMPLDYFIAKYAYQRAGQTLEAALKYVKGEAV